MQLSTKKTIKLLNYKEITNMQTQNFERIKKQQGNKTEDQRIKGRKLNKTQRGKRHEWQEIM